MKITKIHFAISIVKTYIHIIKVRDNNKRYTQLFKTERFFKGNSLKDFKIYNCLTLFLAQ